MTPLEQVIAGISSKKSDGEEGAAMPAHQAPFQAPGPPDPEVQVKSRVDYDMAAE